MPAYNYQINQKTFEARILPCCEHLSKHSCPSTSTYDIYINSDNLFTRDYSFNANWQTRCIACLIEKKLLAVWWMRRSSHSLVAKAKVWSRICSMQNELKLTFDLLTIHSHKPLRPPCLNNKQWVGWEKIYYDCY